MSSASLPVPSAIDARPPATRCTPSATHGSASQLVGIACRFAGSGDPSDFVAVLTTAAQRCPHWQRRPLRRALHLKPGTTNLQSPLKTRQVFCQDEHGSC